MGDLREGGRKREGRWLVMSLSFLSKDEERKNEQKKPSRLTSEGEFLYI